MHATTAVTVATCAKCETKHLGDVCPTCHPEAAKALDKRRKPNALVANEDYYFEKNGFMVFTAKYLLDRGYCCNNGCRHCPYRNSQEGKS